MVFYLLIRIYVYIFMKLILMKSYIESKCSYNYINNFCKQHINI